MRAKMSRVATVLLVVLAGGVGLASAETALTGVQESPVYIFAGYSWGWEFTPQADIEVTKLGSWTPFTYLGYEHRVSIYDVQGNEVVFATVPPNRPDLRGADGYTYVDVDLQSQAKVLSAGVTYTIASFHADTSWDYDVFNGTHSGHSNLIALGQLALYATSQTKPTAPQPGHEFLTANFQFILKPTTIPVKIDIKPGTDPNPINQGSNGVIPVAILTTAEFDAARVDPASVSLNGATVAVRGKSNNLLARMEDVDGDGDADLLCQVDTECWADLFEDGFVTLSGQTFAGMAIEGQDYVIVVPPQP